jgi:hypothetical protein
MVDPPLEAGALKLTLAEALAGVAVAPVGAPGSVGALIVYETGVLVDPSNAAPVVGVYTAVRESVPTGNAVVVSVAVPLVTGCALPTGAPPLSNWTVPGALTSVTFAVNVTDVPESCGLAGVGVSSVVVVVAAGE